MKPLLTDSGLIDSSMLELSAAEPQTHLPFAYIDQLFGSDDFNLSSVALLNSLKRKSLLQQFQPESAVICATNEQREVRNAIVQLIHEVSNHFKLTRTWQLGLLNQLQTDTI